MAAPNRSNLSKSPLQSAGSYDSSSVSSAASPQPQSAGGYSGGLMGASPRVSGQPPHHISLPPSTFSPYGGAYHSNTTSPANQLHDPLAAAGAQTPVSTLPAHANYQAKRAYRQRRKDPSCDACRERKVKCDATETTSCSECSSRNVKCQFTKETNRRMSSIKQVQDLERQVAQYRKEVAQLRGLVDGQGGQGQGRGEEGSPTVPLSLPEVGSHPTRRRQVPSAPDLSRVRNNLRVYGRGIFKPPPPYRQIGSQGHFDPPRPELPPRHVAEHLLESYYSAVHTSLPLLHWPTFRQEYEEAYRLGSLSRIPSAWCSLFFAVLAVGVMYTTEPVVPRPHKGKEYIEWSQRLTDLFNDEFTLDHVRSALLTSVFLMELNLKSASWVWLGSAARLAQDVGLHIESGPWPVIEGEMRRRVWWCVFAWDRLMCLDLGRPLLISDEDVTVSLPATIDDHYIREDGITVPQGVHPPSNLLMPIIHVVRSIGQLSRTLKSPTISPTTLETFDLHYRTCMAAIPSPFHADSQDILDPRSIKPIIALLNVRLILHRHNLSSVCAPDVRSAALQQCLNTALDAARLISRAIPPSAQDGNTGYGQGYRYSSTLFGMTCTTFIATHIWRCTLILLFCHRLDAAATLIRASSAIGSNREVNVACGRNLAMFMSLLIRKRQHGGREADVFDEELMAWVGGDVHASSEEGWVWAGSETGMALNSMGAGYSQYAGGAQTGGAGTWGWERRDGGGERMMPATLTESERSDWGGWERVEGLLEVLRDGTGERGAWFERLMRGEEVRGGLSRTMGVRKENTSLPPLNVGVAGGQRSGVDGSGGPTPATGTPKDRISIANII